MSRYAFPAATQTFPSTSTRPAAPEPDWHVLVLYDEDNAVETIKGIWGPYTSVDIADSALEELRLWPLDGRWDLRRLNKFVARKSGNAPDQLVQWSWQ